jgi:PPM family protein phosphatase
MNKPLILGRLTSHAQTHPGKKREINEDNYLLESWPDKSAILAVVADGMGGHRGGEVASKIAVDTFRELLKQPLPSETLARRDELLLKAFYDAEKAIEEQACQDFGLMNMGTTIIAAIITPTELIHLYAGDCRLYHFRGDSPPYITADHSVVQVLIELGKITPEEVSTHPMRSVVNSCLGGRGKSQLSIDPKWDSSPSPVRELHSGDLLLLCSDGLHGEIRAKHLASLVQQFRDSPEKLTKACVEAALDSGGNDNITVIAIRVGETE